jgi:hypothetical protein
LRKFSLAFLAFYYDVFTMFFVFLELFL